jgi:hypothetical protein
LTRVPFYSTLPLNVGAISVQVSGVKHDLDLDPATPRLYVLSEE